LSKRFLSVNIASKSLKYSSTFWRFIILHLKVPVFSGFLDETGKSFEHDPVKVIAEKGARNVPERTRYEHTCDDSCLRKCCRRNDESSVSR
jgi:hypothetical protein